MIQGYTPKSHRDYIAEIARLNFATRERNKSIDRANKARWYFWKCAAFMLISGFVNVASFFWSYWVLTH